jgi:uncharacterized protein YjdB
MKAKRLLTGFMALLLCSSAFLASCSKGGDDSGGQSTDVKVTEVSIDKIFMNMVVNTEPVQLTATVKPENVTNKEVLWSSSDPEVVTVSENGLVTPVGVGRATITARSATNARRSGSTSITVTPVPIPATGIAFKQPEMKLAKPGDQIKAELVWTPSDATTLPVESWISDKPNIVLADDYGTFTAVALGGPVEVSALVRTSTGELLEAVGTITVTGIPVESIKFDKNRVSLFPEGTDQLLVTYTPEGVTDSTLVWESSNPAVVTVDQQGGITAVARGAATITATAVGGAQATCEVVVSETIITLMETLRVGIGAQQTLTATTDPTGAALAWSSDKPDVVKVDATTGLIEALAAGTATISATPATGLPAVCTVTVDAALPAKSVEVRSTNFPELILGAVEGSIFYFPAGGEYTIEGNVTINKGITLLGGTGGVRPIVRTNAEWRMASEARMENILFQGIDFKPSANAITFINSNVNDAIKNLGTLAFKDCTWDNYTEIFKFQSVAAGVMSVDAFIMEDCIVKNNPGTNKQIINGAQNPAKFGEVVIKNCTFNHMTNVNLVGLHQYKGGITMNIESCTFNDFSDQNQMIRLDAIAAASSITIKDCIFAKDKDINAASSRTRVLWVPQANGGPASFITVNISGNYNTNDFVQQDIAGRTVAMTQYSGSSENLFEEMPNGILRIKDTSFPGKNTAGDPRGRNYSNARR